MDNNEMINKVKKNEENKGFFAKLINTLNKKIVKRKAIYMGTTVLTTALSLALLLAGGFTVGSIVVSLVDLALAIGVTGYGMTRNAKDQQNIKEIQQNIKALEQENAKIKNEFDRQNFASKEPITNYQKHVYRKHVKIDKQTDNGLEK